MDADPTSPDLPAAVHAEQTVLQIPSLPDWITPTVEYLKHKALLSGACEESRAGKLTLALHEALTNSIVHGNLAIASSLKERADDAFARALAERCSDPHYASRPVLIEVSYDGERCQWALTDQGDGFDHQRLLARRADEADLWLASGRGILLMKAFLDDVRYDQGGRRVLLTLLRSSGAEKRQHPRAPLRRRVQIAPVRPDGSVDWGLACAGVAQNLSSSGMAVLQAQLATSERVLIGLETGGRPQFFHAQVRHCRTVEAGMVELGCQFLPDQPGATPAGPPRSVEEAVGGLLAGLERREGRDERRAHPRTAYTERIEVRGLDGGPTLFAYARDLSRGGVSFIATEPVALEMKVLALPQRGGPPLRLRARVVRCARITEGFFDVAAQFQELEG
jgi:anti-sigma regulatory factor (Ser/Thr protein kinase)